MKQQQPLSRRQLDRQDERERGNNDGEDLRRGRPEQGELRRPACRLSGESKVYFLLRIDNSRMGRICSGCAHP